MLVFEGDEKTERRTELAGNGLDNSTVGESIAALRRVPSPQLPIFQKSIGTYGKRQPSLSWSICQYSNHNLNEPRHRLDRGFSG
jgi:hypothetical protein